MMACGCEALLASAGFSRSGCNAMENNTFGWVFRWRCIIRLRSRHAGTSRTCRRPIHSIISTCPTPCSSQERKSRSLGQHSSKWTPAMGGNLLFFWAYCPPIGGYHLFQFCELSNNWYPSTQVCLVAKCSTISFHASLAMVTISHLRQCCPQIKVAPTWLVAADLVLRTMRESDISTEHMRRTVLFVLCDAPPFHVDGRGFHCQDQITPCTPALQKENMTWRINTAAHKWASKTSILVPSEMFWLHKVPISVESTRQFGRAV